MDTHDKRDLDVLVIQKVYHVKSIWLPLQLNRSEFREHENICSSWYGISCRRYTKNVAAINLGAGDLDNTISLSLDNLSLLHFIHIFYSHFTGSILPEFGQLKTLQVFNFDLNHLHGSIPIRLSLSQKLNSLALTNNNFSGSIPRQLGNLTQLTHLKIPRNDMTSSIPSKIFQLPLESLSLSLNLIIRKAIVNLIFLTQLAIYRYMFINIL